MAKSSTAVSSKTFHIAGILTTVYGLDELSPESRSISCLWLLHPRLQTKHIMEAPASRCINEWNKRPLSGRTVGLIAVAFDQRNHGSREVDSKSNDAWREGNETHAQDMFSILHGTALDTSLLMDHLGSYIFHGHDAPSLDQHLVLGVSLGGHSAWQVMFNEPRVTAAVVIIGCPDYMRLMKDRARLSKLQSYTNDKGSSFLGSQDFPKALVKTVEKSDPKGLLFSTSEIPTNPLEAEQQGLRPILDARIKGKSVLVCSGGVDKLVPYHCSEPFLAFLKTSVSGWYKDGHVYVEDVVYDGIGHKFSDGMMEDAVRFVYNTVARLPAGSKSTSKI